MKPSQPIKTVYYTDEKNDEFSRAVIRPRRIDASYPYLPKHRFFYAVRFFLYRVLATPIGFIAFRLSHGFRVRGREKLKETEGKGCFVYANHTQEAADAFFPSYAVFPRSLYIVVHPSNVSQPIVGGVMRYLGALPLPDTIPAMKNFKEAIAARIARGECVAIYPEAHIWPYYTDIRPYSATSFSFPVSSGAPSYAMTVTYRRRRFRKKPRAVLVLDGPFYPDESLPERRRAQDLRDRIYAAMKARAAESDCEYIRYEKKTEETAKTEGEQE